MVEMAKFTSMRERMAKMRNKNKEFHNYMIVELQNMRRIYSIREQEASGGPDDTEMEQLGKTLTRKSSINLNL